MVIPGLFGCYCWDNLVTFGADLGENLGTSCCSFGAELGAKLGTIWCPFGAYLVTFGAHLELFGC